MATATSELQLIITAKDNATKEFGKIGRGLKTLDSGITKMAKYATAAFIGMAGATVAFGVSSLKAFAHAEAEMAKFNTTLKNSGKIGEESRDKILEAAKASVKLGFDDEATANSIAFFLQRTQDLNKALDLNKLTMDLARAKSIELADASKMVSLVMSGNARALKLYGIELDETKTPLEALAELQDKVRGSSEAFANTLQGKMAMLTETWGNFKERIGETLNNALTPLFQVIGDWVNSEQFTQFTDNINLKIQEWIDKMGGPEGIKQKFLEFIEYVKTTVIPQLGILWETLKPLVEWTKRHLDDIGKLALAYIALKVAIMICTPFLAAFNAVLTITVGLVKSIKWLFLLLGGTLSIIAAAIAAATAVAVALNKALDLLGVTNIKVRIIISSLFGPIGGIITLIMKWRRVVDELKAQWEKLKSLLEKGIKATINIFKHEEDSDHKQFGGGVETGRPYIVGEHRPEVFVPSQSGNIRQLGQAGLGKTITVNFNNVSVRNNSDLEAIISEVKKTLNRDNYMSRYGIRTI